MKRHLLLLLFAFFQSCNKDSIQFQSDYEIKEIETKVTNFVLDKPWEAEALGYINVIYEDSIWKLWYESFYPVSKGLKKDYNGVLCYAYSIDGIKWIKPELGLHLFEGKPSNIVFKPLNENGGIHGVGISRTLGDKYKYTMAFSKYFGSNKERPTKVYKMESDDGLNWFEEKLILDHPSDTQNIVKIKDGFYYLFFRRWSGGIHASGKRQIGIVISDKLSFDNKKVKTIKLNGKSIQGKGQYYNSSVKIVNNQFLFFPTVFYPENGGSKIEVAEGTDLNSIAILEHNKLEISKIEDSFKVVAPQIIQNKDIPGDYYIYVMERHGGHDLGSGKVSHTIKRVSVRINKIKE